MLFSVSYSADRSTESNVTLSESDNSVKRKLSGLKKISDIGRRLVEACKTDDKTKLAEILGFHTVQGVYKVLNGSSELDFEKLQKFRDYTKCSIDWLLTGEEPKYVGGSPTVFDLERSIELYDDWQEVLEEWYDFEGRVMPDLGGVAFMGGWEKFDRRQRVAAITDLKMLLDKTMEREAATRAMPAGGKIAARIERPVAQPETNRDIEYVLKGEEDEQVRPAKRRKI